MISDGVSAKHCFVWMERTTINSGYWQLVGKIKIVLKIIVARCLAVNVLSV